MRILLPASNFICSDLDWFSFPGTHPVLHRENAQLQSGEIDDVTEVSTAVQDTVEVVQENVTFEDQDVTMTNSLSMSVDTSHLFDAENTAALGEFLSRPVKIDEFTWSESDTFSTSPHLIHPWQLYFNNTYIKRKLENFARLSCTLRLTFRFNASPFYYGLMRVAYDPLNTNRLAPIAVEDMIPISQAPGVWIEPHKSSSVEIVLPFLWPHNFLTINNNAEFTNIGKLMFEIFSPLRSANGVTGAGISVSTYAVAENVQLAGLSLAPALQAGVISGPATAVAGIARSLSKTPKIGPFARAVDIGASAVAGIASLFGYSNNPVMSDVSGVHPKSFHAFANVETSMPLDKLAIDPENQVTVDNRVTGCDGEDPLVISDLVQKISYLGQVDWAGSNAIGTKLMTFAVTPGLCNWVVGTNQTITRMTPCGWTASFFHYWHGSMKFTFKIVKSQFHKGRLLICWDPNPLIPTASAETALYTQIIDLSSEQDTYEFIVPYKSVQPWLRSNQKSDGFVASGDATPDPSTTNGMVAVYVQNVLTGPAVSPVVGVLLSVSAMPDMEFAIPYTIDNNITTNALQSGTIDGTPTNVNDKLTLVTVGETIASLRQILHRTSFSYSQIAGDFMLGDSTFVNSGWVNTINRFPRLPPEYGFNSTGLSWSTKVLSSGSAPFNYASNHPINLVLSAFVGYRGSTVAHVNCIAGGTNVPEVHGLSITRTRNDLIVRPTLQGRNRHQITARASAPSDISRLCTTFQYGNPRKSWGQSGMTLTNPKTQAAASAHIPMYSQWRFQPAWGPYRDFVPTSGDRSVGALSNDNIRIDTTFYNTANCTSTSDWPVLDVYYSAGVDFQPVFFVGVPRMVMYSPPNADNAFTPSTT